MSQVHEFMMLTFRDKVDDVEQLRTMRALDTHLGGCPGLLRREYYRDGEGRWVEHVVWASDSDIEASVRLEDDPAVALLFERFDGRSVSYLRGERIEPEDLELSGEALGR